MSHKFSQDDLGFYFHIPFCRSICHYCDFPKTARYDPELLNAYVDKLLTLTKNYIELLAVKPGRVSSVFFGGGTPSLLDGEELRGLFSLLQPYLMPGAEVSIEANPDDLSSEKLSIWADLGINRLSIGVQTFNAAGLEALTRRHKKRDNIRAIERARTFFQNINIDLIYGWHQQTIDAWREDLQRALDFDIPHLSLYNLTFETGTALGQMLKKGKIHIADDEELFQFYDVARSSLGERGYLHEEVSNWTKPGFSCRHNWLYWQGLNFVGIGSGAHGFLSASEAIGLRYAYPPQVARFMAEGPIDTSTVSAFIRSSGGNIETRDESAWLYEYVGCGLRCDEGIDLVLIKAITGFTFRPSSMVSEGIKRGLLHVTPESRLLLDETQWFRETSWSLEVVLSFH